MCPDRDPPATTVSNFKDLIDVRVPSRLKVEWLGLLTYPGKETLNLRNLSDGDSTGDYLVWQRVHRNTDYEAWYEPYRYWQVEPYVFYECPYEWEQLVYFNGVWRFGDLGKIQFMDVAIKNKPEHRLRIYGSVYEKSNLIQCSTIDPRGKQTPLSVNETIALLEERCPYR